MKRKKNVRDSPSLYSGHCPSQKELAKAIRT